MEYSGGGLAGPQRLRRALLDLYTASEAEGLVKEQQVVQAENVRLLEQQFEAGVISAFEVTQARIALTAHAWFCGTRSGSELKLRPRLPTLSVCPSPH